MGDDEADRGRREEQAIQRVTSTLVENFAGTHPAERVERAVGSVRERFTGHPVREFVPILVERIVRRELGAPAGEVPAGERVSVTTAAEPGGTGAEQAAARPEPEEPPRRPAPPDTGHDPAPGTGPVPATATTISAATPAQPTATPSASHGRHALRETITPSDAADHWTFQAVARKWTVERPLVPMVVGLVLVLAAVAGVVATRPGDAPPQPVAAASAPATVRGLVGSEKMGFLTDPRVVEVFARHGLEVAVEPAGSRQIASLDLDDYEFVFPSSATAADRIQREQDISATYTPFSSPMAVATFTPIVEALTAAGVMRPGPVPTLDVARYLQLVRDNVEWQRLPGNTTYPVGKNVLLSTTDPRTSNSAAMYLAVAGFVANDNAVVAGAEAEQKVLPLLARLFAGQGRTEDTSAGPFREYLSVGMGPAPLVWIYESQFVGAVVAGQTQPGMVLAYPSPTVVSQHTLVPLGDAGDRVGRLLSTDPELQRLAAEHGFRTGDPAQFAAVTRERRVPVADEVIDVIDTPTSETLERLIDGVAASYR